MFNNISPEEREYWQRMKPLEERLRESGRKLNLALKKWLEQQLERDKAWLMAQLAMPAGKVYDMCDLSEDEERQWKENLRKIRLAQPKITS